MRRFLSISFQLLVILSVLMLLFSAVLWGLSRSWWGYTLEEYSFADLLGLGLVRFWQDGAGVGIIGCVVVMAAYYLLNWLTDFWNLKARQRAVAQDIEKKTAQRAEAMLADLETAVARSNEDTSKRLAEWQTRLAVAHREILEREKKVNAYLAELKALRELHARYEVDRLMVRQRAQQALDELSLDEPAIEKVKRLVQKIVKLS